VSGWAFSGQGLPNDIVLGFGRIGVWLAIAMLCFFQIPYRIFGRWITMACFGWNR
jgi:hypothetical protein